MGTAGCFARLAPERVDVVETYRCRQEISRTPSFSLLDGEAWGEIRVVVPLDDPACYRDREGLERETHFTGGEDADTWTGHLLVGRIERTDIDRAMPGASRFGAVPLRIPPLPDRSAQGGRRAAVLDIGYTPELPEIPPLDVQMELLDSDAKAGEWIDLGDQDAAGDPGRVADLMTMRLGREQGLLLKVRLAVALPRRLVQEAGDSLRLRARVDLRWPTTPAPESVRLLEVTKVEEEEGERRTVQRPPVPYDPTERSLRWPQIPLEREGERRGNEDERGSTESDFVFFTSRDRFLLIERAEDLDSSSELRARVEVEVSNLLLSELQVRTYGADGRIDRTEARVARTTRIEGEVDLILDDAVRSWRRSPVQHLHFEQVILDERRIEDVRTALRDLGFSVVDGGRSDRAGDRLVRGRRAEGGATLWLWVYLQGRHSSAQRRTELAGGQTYTTEVASGDLEVKVRGQLQGDPRPILDAMHSLHERLRHQFLAATDRR